MNVPLATFTVHVPKYSRATLPVSPYETYPSQLKELLPEDHFNYRLDALRSYVHRRYPSPYWDIGFTVVVTLSIISFSSIFFASFIGKIPVWYSACVIGFLIVISTTYGFRARKGADLIGRFDHDLVKMLREFTAVDLPKHGLRWSISRRPSSLHSNQTTLSSPPVFTVTIIEYDPYFGLDELPAYVNSHDYVQPEIVISNPPGYDTVARMAADERARMERFVAGEESDDEESRIGEREGEGERRNRNSDGGRGREREREGEGEGEGENQSMYRVVGSRHQIDDVILPTQRQQRPCGPIAFDWSLGGEVTLVEMGEIISGGERAGLVLPEVVLTIPEEGAEIAPGEDPLRYEGVVMQNTQVTSVAPAEGDGVSRQNSVHENGSSSTS